LDEIAAEMARLPHGRTPTARDWRVISGSIRAVLDGKIAQLERTRDRLDGCIGCGCLSLANCAIYNPDDRLSAQGPGPRQLL
jgi:MerR family redox-sensitive transcriptional activator SoxR